MSYEKEIKHLMRELKFAKSDYLNARLKSEDALRIHSFKTDVETIEFQIEVFKKAAKADEYEAKNKEPLEELKYLKKVNKELLEELKYLKKVNNDLVWQRDTDEEHEAKAESYTKLVSQINAMNAIVATNYDKDMTDTNLHLLMLGAEVKRFFESGEPNAKK